MEWLWGIGLAFDIAGALLIVFPILTKPRWSRGLLIAQSEPTRDALAEVAYTEVGFMLLATGFGLQLAGYVVSAERWWALLLVVAAAAVIAFVAAGVFVGRYWLPVVHRAAIDEYRKTETYRQERPRLRSVWPATAGARPLAPAAARRAERARAR